MPVNFNALMDPREVGMSFQQGYDEQQRRMEQQSAKAAMRDFAMNPNDPSIVGRLAPSDARLAMQIGKQQREQTREDRERALTGRALNGDPEALRALSYVNHDTYLQLDKASRERTDVVMKAIGQHAMRVLQLPENQRGAAMQQALADLRANGLDVDQLQLSGDPTRDAYLGLAMAGMLDDWEKFSQPRYEAVGEGGLVGFQYGQPIQQNGQTQNFAPQQGLPRVTSPDEARRLPPGSQFVMPDGRVGTVPGGGVSNGTGGFLPVQ